MIAKVQDTFFMKLGSSMEIEKKDLAEIANQIENVINTNFPHIRVHIGHWKDLMEDDANEMMAHGLAGIPHPDAETIVLDANAK